MSLIFIPDDVWTIIAPIVDIRSKAPNKLFANERKKTIEKAASIIQTFYLSKRPREYFLHRRRVKEYSRVILGLIEGLRHINA